MQHSFEYMYTTTALDSLEVQEIGQCAINMLNDNYLEYYLIVESILGNTQVTTFGPVMVDQNNTEKEFYVQKQQFQYNENKIIKLIQNYLSDPKKNITQAFEIDPETAKERFHQLFIL